MSNIGAFGLLYDRHSCAAFGLAYRILGDPSIAEDVVQDVFLSLWRQAETLQPGRAAVRSWLLSIVHRRAIDRLRRTSTREAPYTAADGMPARMAEDVAIERHAKI